MKWAHILVTVGIAFAFLASLGDTRSAWNFSRMGISPSVVSASAGNGRMATPVQSVNNSYSQGEIRVHLNIDDGVFPGPAKSLQTVIVTEDWTATAMTRLVVNGEQLATVKTQNILIAAWVPQYEGEYLLWASESGSNVIESNTLTLIVGQAPNTKICAGGLLPQSATASEMNDYQNRYDTLNCRYMEPPRCPLYVEDVKNCTP